jgi:hypothetical protein
MPGLFAERRETRSHAHPRGGWTQPTRARLAVSERPAGLHVHEQPQHVVIVVVRHQGTNTVAPSSVTIDPSVRASTKPTVGGAEPAGTGIAEDKLCSLNKGDFRGLGHATDKPFDVTTTSHP